MGGNKFRGLFNAAAMHAAERGLQEQAGIFPAAGQFCAAIYNERFAMTYGATLDRYANAGTARLTRLFRLRSRINLFESDERSPRTGWSQLRD